MGVEVEKQLSEQAVRQAELKYYVLENDSLFPFSQLVTGMETGGVAFYRRLSTPGKLTSVRQLILKLLSRANSQQQLQQQHAYVPAAESERNTLISVIVQCSCRLCP